MRSKRLEIEFTSDEALVLYAWLMERYGVWALASRSSGV